MKANVLVYYDKIYLHTPLSRSSQLNCSKMREDLSQKLCKLSKTLLMVGRKRIVSSN